MSAISFWYRLGRFPQRRAARFGAPPASSSTGTTNSFGWTPEPSRVPSGRTVPNRHDRAHAEQAQTGTSTAPVGHLPGTDHHYARHGYIGGADELAAVTTELAAGCVTRTERS